MRRFSLYVGGALVGLVLLTAVAPATTRRSAVTTAITPIPSRRV